MIWALQEELRIQKNYLNGAKIETIYLGGGTPSLLSQHELMALFETIWAHYDVVASPEITLEANPDDLTTDQLKVLAAAPINRLSIGVQSFDNHFLQLMNRAHSAAMAVACVKAAQELGFDNISIDLIYGIPGLSLQQWEQTLGQAFDLKVQHLSSYCLTLEPRTYFAHLQKEGKWPNCEESLIEEQFKLLRQQSLLHGFEHYEISNFCRPGRASLHNGNYWLKAHYLGIGPSAHSYNEFVAYFLENAKAHVEAGLLHIDHNLIHVTEKGMLLADGIASDLFWVD